MALINLNLSAVLSISNCKQIVLKNDEGEFCNGFSLLAFLFLGVAKMSKNSSSFFLNKEWFSSILELFSIALKIERVRWLIIRPTISFSDVFFWEPELCWDLIGLLDLSGYYGDYRAEFLYHSFCSY